MHGRTKALVVILFAVAAWGVWKANTTLIWRDEEYWRLVSGYRLAEPPPKLPDPRDAQLVKRWDRELIISRGVRATFHLTEGFTTATIKYSDEQESRQLYEYRDYTSAVDVRLHGSDIYLLRYVALITEEYRLMHYSVERREVIADRRVDLQDLGDNRVPASR